ncbi:MAG: HAD hydrolase family protein [Lachnospiraceae bacterium]|nr:HAD hydrolase family protein [Lachnospiraceae bacterium]
MGSHKNLTKKEAQEKIKLITLDFDGTLLQKDQTWISFRNIHALRECQRRGIICVPCSGRSANMFPPQIDRDMTFRYWVTAAGSRVIDRWTGEVLYCETFTPEQGADLARLYEGQGIYSEVAADGSLYFEQAVLDEIWKYPVPPHHVWYVDSGKQIGVRGKLSEFILQEQLGVEKYNLYGVPEDKQDAIIEGLKVRPYVEFLDGSRKDIQFYSTNTDRVAAMQTLLDRLGLTFDNVMSLGDSMGMDASMITRAGLGIAMENGDERLKEVADDVTARFDQDGVAKAIEKWLL